MKNLLCVFLSVIILISSGCGFSQPSRFYRLSPSSARDIQNKVQSSDVITVSVGPLTIPASLNRPQIVSLSDDNSVNISEYDRWAGSLNDNIMRTLTENLSMLLPSKTVVPHELGRRLDNTFQVIVDIQQLDGILDKYVSLKASWIIIDKNTRKTLSIKKSVITQEVKGAGYNYFVSAMSDAICKLSSDMASEITAVSATQKK